MSENNAEAVAAGEQGNSSEQQQPNGEERTFTQADVDRLIADRLKRERSRYADYDELKKAAEGRKTAEDRIADLERQYSEATARALRADIANRHGISAEDRDLFLTATDEDALNAQAKRLAEAVAAQKRNNPRVPKEGNNPSGNGGGSDALREFARAVHHREA